jgi:hypothetical protein
MRNGAGGYKPIRMAPFIRDRTAQHLALARKMKFDHTIRKTPGCRVSANATILTSDSAIVQADTLCYRCSTQGRVSGLFIPYRCEISGLSS